MNFNKFDFSIFGGILLGWIQLMIGYESHAFYSLGILITTILMGILLYLREIYMKSK